MAAKKKKKAAAKKSRSRRSAAGRPHEVVVYIHGVSQDLRGRSHASEYAATHEGVGRENAAWPSRYLGVEWGWNAAAGAPREHEALTDAQRQLGARLMPVLTAESDLSLNPGRLIVNNLRPLMFYGFSDMFYYVSSDGKRSVRNAVAGQIAAFLHAERADDQPLSLTLLGHSAGSVIALDFLFFLFNAQEGVTHEYLCATESAAGPAHALRAMAQDGRLRVRRLITFGSPITMVACRSDAVVEFLSEGGELDPTAHGLLSEIAGATPVEGPRWINLWDRDDPIAWPVEPLVGDAADGRPCAEDVYVDVSDSVSKSHGKYWHSGLVHREIASRW